MEKQFIELITTHQRLVHKVCRLYCPDPAERADLLQEVLLQLWRAFPGFRGEARPTTWLYRVAHNVAYAYTRKRRRQLQAELQVWPLPEPGAPPDDGRHRALLDAVQQLAPIDRQVVLLHLEGLSSHEIEQVTGFSANSICVRLSRLRRKLASIVTGKEVGQ